MACAKLEEISRALDVKIEIFYSNECTINVKSVQTTVNVTELTSEYTASMFGVFSMLQWIDFLGIRSPSTYHTMDIRVLGNGNVSRGVRAGVGGWGEGIGI